MGSQWLAGMMDAMDEVSDLVTRKCNDAKRRNVYCWHQYGWELLHGSQGATMVIGNVK